MAGAQKMIRIFGHYTDVPAIVLAAVELSILFTLFILNKHLLGSLGVPTDSVETTLSAVLTTLVTAIGLFAVGLYNREHLLQLDDTVARSLPVLPALTLLIMGLFWIHDRFMVTPALSDAYLICVVSMTLFIVPLLGVRWAFVQFVDRTRIFSRRVAVIGFGPRAAKIEYLCKAHLDRCFTVTGYIRLHAKKHQHNPAEDERRGSARRPDYWLMPAELPAFCAEHKIKELVVAMHDRRGRLPVTDLVACKMTGVTITEYATFWERETRQIDLHEISPGWLVFSDGFRVGHVRSFIKRTFDIVVSLLLLILTLPITVVTAILIKLESPGDIFYRQERVGLNGQPYNILKFRSMRRDAEKDGPRWAAKNDARVTRVGAVIRKVRIDEIPQVINVLKGEMAFVGPRPERPVFVAALTEKIPFYMERHSIKPGITGWAQINYPYGATEEDARMKLSYDLYYAKNGNIFLDFLIIIQTVKVLLWHSGAR